MALEKAQAGWSVSTMTPQEAGTEASSSSFAATSSLTGVPATLRALETLITYLSSITTTDTPLKTYSSNALATSLNW